MISTASLFTHNSAQQQEEGTLLSRAITMPGSAGLTGPKSPDGSALPLGVANLPFLRGGLFCMRGLIFQDRLYDSGQAIYLKGTHTDGNSAAARIPVNICW